MGGLEEIKVDVRFIGATNKDIEQEVVQGIFREDLFYRLSGMIIKVPPLRERDDDILLLAEHFLEKFSKEQNKIIKGFSPEAMDKMIKYSWPGNIRELFNAVERAVILAKGNFIKKHDIIIEGQNNIKNNIEVENEENFEPELLKNIEQKAILKTLKAMKNNKSATAKKLGITRKTLHKKLKEYGVD